MSLQVHPLTLGSLIMSGAVLQRLTNFPENAFPCLGFLILGGTKTILVDTGAPEPDIGVKVVRPVVRNEGEFLIPQLARFGLKPDDIDIIVNTHLHYDHIYGNGKIPNAEVIVQQAELDYYANPLPCDRNSYEKNKEKPFVETFYDRIKAVNGDTEIIPGVKLLLTPGHTPGCQTVLVKTADGIVALPGDNISLFSSLKSTPPSLPGIVVDARDFYKSMEKLSHYNIVKYYPAHDSALAPAWKPWDQEKIKQAKEGKLVSDASYFPPRD